MAHGPARDDAIKRFDGWGIAGRVMLAYGRLTSADDHYFDRGATLGSGQFVAT